MADKILRQRLDEDACGEPHKMFVWVFGNDNGASEEVLAVEWASSFRKTCKPQVRVDLVNGWCAQFLV